MPKVRLRDTFNIEDIRRHVHDSLNDLLQYDRALIVNNVSERAITHKLAEYLQKRFSTLHVDCEYNRDYERGEGARKELYLLRGERDDKIRAGLSEEDMLAVSTYPDIIVHRRLVNSENLLVIEVKKTNSNVDATFDHRKLSAFTDNTDCNKYHFKYGIFILIDIGENPVAPKLTWFGEGLMLDESGDT